MEKELKELLIKVLANQAAIYKKLDEIDARSKGISRVMGNASVVNTLEREANKFIEHIKI